MAQFNNYTVIKRYNRPSILAKTLLEMFFANNGTYFNPFSVSEVYILPDNTSTWGSPDIYINRDISAIGTSAYGMLGDHGVSSTVAVYNVSNSPTMLESDYDPTTSAASGIFHPSSVSSGHFGVVADGIVFSSFSGIGDYFDVWLVQDFSGFGASSGWHLYWNKFSAYNDRIVTYTEPFEVNTRNKLRQKYITLSSIVDLAVETDVFLANHNLAEPDKNIWRDAVIDAGTVAINIERRNPQTTGRRTSIVEWETSSVQVNSSNTILYKWDTSTMQKGDYVVQVKYELLGQTFYSEEFSVVLR